MANLPIVGAQDNLPEGEFLLPICTDADDLRAMLSDLMYAMLRSQRDISNPLNRVLNAMAYIDEPENAPCNPCAAVGGCQQFDAVWNKVTYYPNDPRDPESEYPSYFPAPPWYLITDGVTSPYQIGDVLTDPTKFPTWATLPQLLSEGLPYIEVEVEGEGEVELEFLEVPAGGFVMIQIDGNPLTNSFHVMDSLDLAPTLGALADLFEFVIEGDLFRSQKVELTLEGTGTHTIRMTAVPRIGGESILGYGFGLRSVTLCDFPDMCDCEECEDMDCEDVLDCVEPELQTMISQQFNANLTLWQQMPAVTDVQDAYDQGGATAVDPDATGLFRRDNTAMERYISIAAIYYVAAQWQMAQYNQLRTKALASSAIASISPQFISLGAVVPAIVGFFGLTNFIDVLPALETLSNFDALADVIASSWINMNDEPETFTGWQVGAQSSYYVDTPEENALRDIIASDFFTDEKNFVAYLAARQQISDRVKNGGQPFFGRGQHWVDESLVSNEYAEWLLERSQGTTWQGIEMMQGTFDTEPVAVSDGSYYHVEFKLEFGQVVNVTGIYVDYERTHASGAYTNLQNIRRIRLYNGDTLQWETDFQSDSIISFGSLSRGRGSGFDATRVEVYARRVAYKTSDMRITRLRVTGEHFPPTRFWT